jgi:hypothetical protein
MKDCAHYGAIYSKVVLSQYSRLGASCVRPLFLSPFTPDEHGEIPQMPTNNATNSVAAQTCVCRLKAMDYVGCGVGGHIMRTTSTASGPRATGTSLR